jgi:hypothetical protein
MVRHFGGRVKWQKRKLGNCFDIVVRVKLKSTFVLSEWVPPDSSIVILLTIAAMPWLALNPVSPDWHL